MSWFFSSETGAETSAKTGAKTGPKRVLISSDSDLDNLPNIASNVEDLIFYRFTATKDYLFKLRSVPDKVERVIFVDFRLEDAESGTEAFKLFKNITHVNFHGYDLERTEGIRELISFWLSPGYNFDSVCFVGCKVGDAMKKWLEKKIITSKGPRALGFRGCELTAEHMTSFLLSRSILMNSIIHYSLDYNGKIYSEYDLNEPLSAPVFTGWKNKEKSN